MEMQSVHATPVQVQPPEAALAQLLDRKHLRHQTLGDQALETIVLQLFLDEAPRYSDDIVKASDEKSWRMAVHTLKGVALNLGAFRLAQVCREHENPMICADPARTRRGAQHIAATIEATAGAIKAIL